MTHTFIRDINAATPTILVVKTSQIEPLMFDNIYDQFGILWDEGGEGYEGEEYGQGFNFHNGQNWETVVLSSDYTLDLQYEIVDDEEAAMYYSILKQAELAETRAGVMESDEIEADDKTYIVEQSNYQGRWDLYAIIEQQ